MVLLPEIALVLKPAEAFVQNSPLTTALGAMGNLLQEFWLRHMTPNVPDYTAH